MIEDALGRARLGRSVAGMTDDAREELIDALLDQLSAGRDGLPEELRERLLDGMIDELIAGKRGEREILGQDGVLGEVTRRMVQRALEEELTEHLGYPAGQAPPGGAGTPERRDAQDAPDRSGSGSDRHSAGSQEPLRAAAGQEGPAAAGRSGREDHRPVRRRDDHPRDRDLHHRAVRPGVSRETVSRVTAAVLEDAKAWQTRPLEQIYPILYLDALMIKIRDGQAVRNFACSWRSG